MLPENRRSDIILMERAHQATKGILLEVSQAEAGEMGKGLGQYLAQTDSLTGLTNKELLFYVVQDINLTQGDSQIHGNVDHLGEDQPSVIEMAWCSDEEVAPPIFGVVLNLDADFTKGSLSNKKKLEIVQAFVRTMSKIIASESPIFLSSESVMEQAAI